MAKLYLFIYLLHGLYLSLKREQLLLWLKTLTRHTYSDVDIILFLN